MTVEENLPPALATGGEHRRMDSRNAGSAARDIERYAALFAQRTRVMTSSAMRDLMAITERPEVISLAGGLPDTSTFPAETPGRRDGSRGGRLVGASAPVRPDRGHALHARGHRPRDGGRGPRRGPRRHDRHDRRPAGHRPRLQDPARPGRRRRRRGPDVPGRGPDALELPGRRRADRDGRRRHARGRARGDARPPRARGAPAEVHLHRADLPEPRRGDAVAAAAPAPRRGRPAARDRRARGRPVRDAAVRGRAAAEADGARRRSVRDLRGDVLEDPLPRRPPGLGGRAAARCWRSSTSAPRPRRCARPRSRSCSSARTSTPATGRATSTGCAISTASGAT